MDSKRRIGSIYIYIYIYIYEWRNFQSNVVKHALQFSHQESENQDLEQTGDSDKLRAEVYALQVSSVRLARISEKQPSMKQILSAVTKDCCVCLFSPHFILKFVSLYLWFSWNCFEVTDNFLLSHLCVAFNVKLSSC